MISYNLLEKIHSFVKKEYWIYSEEWICNFLLDYGEKVFNLANKLLGVII